MSASPSIRRLLARAGLTLLVFVGVFSVWSGTRVVKAWLDTERIDYDTTQASTDVAAADDRLREQVAAEIREAEAAEDAANTETPPQGDSTLATDDEIAGLEGLITADTRIGSEVLQTYLVIGTDRRPGDGELGRADVIMMLMLPPSADPILLSIPRDLWIPNPCTGGMSRINANLNGCGERASGPELLSLAVEQYTGVRVDHLVVFDFEGFVEIVDRVGGVEVCVEQTVKTDWRAGPEVIFEPGCTRTDGEGALAWMRSRHTLVLDDGGAWVTMAGVNDLERNRRQQEMLIQALQRLKSFRNITEFASLVETLTDTFTIDDDLSLWAAISLAWSQRDLDPASIQRPVIPTRFYETDAGAIVLIPTAPFEEVLASVYPDVEDLLAVAP